MDDETREAMRLLGAAGVIAPDVDGAQALDDVEAFIRRYVVFGSGAQAVAVALWTAHTHAFAAAEATPYLSVTSPEKRSGKTRLQEVLELLVARPLRTSNISTAALFREIDAQSVTGFFDEADAIFSRKGDTAEELRGILNAGHRKGATVARCVGEGKSMRTHRFSVFCPKLIAAIGQLPDTIADRSIAIRLQRRRKSDRVERFRYRSAREAGETFRGALAAWADEHLDALGDARPELPDALDDRAQDGWEPLLAIADEAGGTWPERARAAAAELAEDDSGDDSLGILLLHHVRDAFEAASADKLFTAGLLASLVDRDDGPWAEWWGREVENGNTKSPAARVARLLAPYDIEPTKIRIHEKTGRGYHRATFEPVWERYLDPVPRPKPPVPSKRRNNGTSQVKGPFQGEAKEPKEGADQDCSVVPSFQRNRPGNDVTDPSGSMVERVKREAHDPVAAVLRIMPGSEVIEVLDAAPTPTPSEPTINRLQKGRRQ